MINIPNKISAFFLDFDGVVVESSKIKTQAFYELFLPYGKNIAERVVSYHLKHQGINRFHKFAYIGEHFVNKIFTEEELNNLSVKFSELVLQKILEAPLVAGIQDFLAKMIDIPKFVISATPHEELIGICDSKKLLSYFKEVHGGPKSKFEIGNSILQRYGFDARYVVFIGDSLQDYLAACKIGTSFIGRVVKDSKNPFDDTVAVIQDFKDYERIYF